jgi:hypothetical protein
MTKLEQIIKSKSSEGLLESNTRSVNGILISSLLIFFHFRNTPTAVNMLLTHKSFYVLIKAHNCRRHSYVLTTRLLATSNIRLS